MSNELYSVKFGIGRFRLNFFEKFPMSGFSFWVDSMLIEESNEHVESSDAYRILE